MYICAFQPILRRILCFSQSFPIIISRKKQQFLKEIIEDVFVCLMLSTCITENKVVCFQYIFFPSSWISSNAYLLAFHISCIFILRLKRFPWEWSHKMGMLVCFVIISIIPFFLFFLFISSFLYDFFFIRYQRRYGVRKNMRFTCYKIPHTHIKHQTQT